MSVFVNELLCFLKHTMLITDKPDFSVISKIILDFYSISEIETAKNMVTEFISDQFSSELKNSESIFSKLTTNRRDPNKSHKILLDIFNSFSELIKSDSLPNFLASDLSKLPPLKPVDSSHLDDIKLDLTVIKDKLSSISSSFPSLTDSTGTSIKPTFAQILDNALAKNTKSFNSQIKQFSQPTSQSSKYDVIIKNIPVANLDIVFVNDLVAELGMNSGQLINTSFHGKIAKLSFSCDFNRELFFAKIKNSKKHSNLFCHSSLPPAEIKRGSILFHAIKSNFVTNHKCVLNKRNNTFELRHIVDDKVNWKNDPLSISDSKLSEWSSSLKEFRKSMPSSTKVSNN